ncbi:metallophosphoesterase [Domibacillus epiphyticus]|uniref:metallophosphoesterase n=1 Tax=Domibacillus epiphyticus TaxID=1714355 RepID=UPI0009FB1268|nr:metallophosphoesterase [Domibacillus epiphyticus]
MYRKLFYSLIAGCGLLFFFIVFSVLIVKAEDTAAPIITHTPVESVSSGTDVTIRAAVKDETKIDSVKIYYRMTADGSWLEKEMAAGNEEGFFEAVIAASEFLSGQITYRIEAFDGQNTAKTEEYTVVLEGMEYEPQDVPELLVTELVPDSANVGRFDGYEFIEVYNNTDQDINLNDYTLRYRYPMEGPEADLIWKSDQKDLILPSGETMVYWIINAGNEDKTIDDFNKVYGSALEENAAIVKLRSDGMANLSHRGVAIATNTGEDISTAFYHDQPNVDDTEENKAILYTFPRGSGNNEMKKYSSTKAKATPGVVSSMQVPAIKRKAIVDAQAPTVTDLTKMAPISARQNVSLSFDVKDDQSVKTVRLFYKTDKAELFTYVDLTKQEETGLYSHTVFSPDLLGKMNLQYYVRVSDGTNEVETDQTGISILSDSIEKTGLNVENGSLLSKTAVIKSFGSDSRLSIDGKDVTEKTKPSIPSQAYFAFDVKKVNLYFKNGVTIDDKTLHMFDDTINAYTTMTVPVDPSQFTKDKETKISIRAGTKVSPFDTNSEENRDDFYVKNIRLVLEDGTTLYDPFYRGTDQEIRVGDTSSAEPVLDFRFTLPDKAFTAKAYSWDTLQAEEGNYLIKADGLVQAKANVIVDNSAPVITPSVKEGKEYKGNFTIEAEVEDNFSDIKSLTAKLDGEQIKLPFETSSAKIAAGGHAVEFTAVDRAGNSAKKSVLFTVVEEEPYAPELVMPEDGAEGIHPNKANLQVKVTDPTKDRLKVTFFRGYKYRASDREIRIFENSARREPPKELLPAGEKAVKEKDKMAKADGEYIETSSVDGFPYHRFEVAIDEKTDELDEIVLSWEGKSLIGRKVSMYIWNYTLTKWERHEWKVAVNSENFTLTGRVKGKDYVKNRKVQVMIQDEIASTPEFNYSFIWMSDTQYYSESYPHIFDRMTTWAAEQKDEMNVKYVFHTGDLVDEADQPIQWGRADQYMETLDIAQIPYGVLAGNHDVDHKTGDYKEFSKYFGEHRFAGKEHYGASYKDNRGHYDVISSNGNDFIMLYMGWGVNEEDIAWMNNVLAEHPDRKAILCFHEYLLVSGNRSPIGDKIFHEVIKKNKNVIAVLSGHYHDSETLIDEIDDDGDGRTDRKVYQMLADYQGGPEGGQGFLRLMKVNPIENKIYMQTYSPYLNQYNYYNPVDYPGKDEFVFELDLTPKEKVVATDLFKAEVFTDEQIGSKADVGDDEFASAEWVNLEKNMRHSWYVQVNDSYGGKVRSDVWSFTASD